MRKLKNSELGRITTEQYRSAEKNPVVIVLDNVRSLSNTGSVFRTSDAFMVEAIHLCGITGTPPHREINKTALGATESVPWKYYADSITSVTELREKGYTIVAIEQVDESIDLASFRLQPGKKYGIVFGHEVNGISQELIDICDVCVEIPQYGTKHSLNIAVTAGIVLWELAGRSLKR
jgi:23S rRNA (guanosine2251-2'-O)-methyltransferase